MDWLNQFLFDSRLDVTPGAVICVEAELKGDVKIGKLTIVHPYARILATSGPIVIGESNIIEEFATIENRLKKIRNSANLN